ncbi:hypothetical protein F0169_00675 [Pseudomonas sp. MAFF 212408]|uniref:Uncharacterized protein n=1 Tax=Pseudomonas kitaguniensis TaxID=2607908 RepID=A0A5N7KFF3_9PSED|nr:hypothetical protein [Pseudomonas kitaguniensis]MPR00710.1 hypothetical protein [Pseudomonas kitaguniensis]
MTDKMREEFEKSPRFRGMNFTRSITHPNFYESPYANGAWDGWQASREAVVIDLPTESTQCVDGEFVYLDLARAAIEAAGLKVKS